MRYIEITQDIEKALVAVFDSALRGVGYQIKNSIDLIERSIKKQEDPDPTGSNKLELVKG